MRNLLLSLLLANVLYFLWGLFADDSDEPGIAIVTESDLGPPLQLVKSSKSRARTGMGKPSEIAAVTGRSCVSIGPFTETGDADAVLSEFEDQGLRASMRTTEGEIFVGHWVQIRGIENRASADRMLKKLQDGGLNEAYMVQTDDEGIKISLGLFGDMSGAEHIELQAESMGLPAEITPRMREATVFYVDIGLPPGRGAGTMIERYGEDRVLLRSAATCPRPS